MKLIMAHVNPEWRDTVWFFAPGLTGAYRYNSYEEACDARTKQGGYGQVFGFENGRCLVEIPSLETVEALNEFFDAD